MMSQRDRQWTTFILWAVFIFLILMTWDNLMVMTADFAGLWPQGQDYFYPSAQDAEQINQAVAAAREVAPAMLTQVQESIRAQLVVRVPLVLALSGMLVFAATLCTYFVWRNAGLEAYLAREAVQAEKVKRHSRIEQLMEDLEPEELAQLRTRLIDDETKAQHLS